MKIFPASAVYSGSGNTFVLIDNRNRAFPLEMRTALCEREKVQGLILLEPSTRADGKMRIFNENGQEAEMCGNGIRCLIAFMRALGIQKKTYTIETKAGKRAARIEKGEIVISMGKVEDVQVTPSHIFLNTGVPHVVFFVDDLENDPLVEQALSLRDKFPPNGANVNLVKVLDRQNLALRTFERGLFEESPACGTGACAAAYSAHILHQLPTTLHVHPQSKKTLTVSIAPDQTVELSGPVHCIRTFDLNLTPSSSRI